jgi:TLC domain
VFLLWELSTPFVHGRWFLYVYGLKDSLLYVVNGLLMMAVFFASRNVFGTSKDCAVDVSHY